MRHLEASEIPLQTTAAAELTATEVATCLGSHMIHPDASVGHKAGQLRVLRRDDFGEMGSRAKVLPPRFKRPNSLVFIGVPGF